jgi:hypothetical protein
MSKYSDLEYIHDGSLRWTGQNPSHTRKLGEPAGHLCEHGGYWRIKIGKKAHMLHRVIYEMHYGAIPDGMDVDHIDNNRTNNRIENLQLLTRAQNVLKGMREGNHNNPETPVIGVCVATGKVIEFISQAEAERAGFTQANISKCIKGERKTCKGYRWSYANKEKAA